MADIPISKMVVPGSNDVLVLKDSSAANKVSSPTSGNLAGLDALGNLTDAGWTSDKTTTSATGNPISISGLKSNQLAMNPVITLEPIQAGSGDPSPSNIRAISGYDKIEVLSCGKNLLPYPYTDGNSKTIAGVTFTVDFNGVISTSGSSVSAQDDGYFIVMQRYFVPNGNYIVSGASLNTNGTMRLSIMKNRTTTHLAWIGKEHGTSASFTVNGDDYSNDGAYMDAFIEYWGADTNNDIWYPMIRLASITDPTYEPYNPITNIQLTLGQTIYGGTLDIEKGILTVTRKYLDCKSLGFEGSGSAGGLDWAEVYDCKSPYGPDTISNKLVPKTSSDGWTSTTPCYSVASGGILRIYGSQELFTTGDYADSVVVGTLITPHTIQLTPHEISLLKDYAYVSTNGTNIQFSYHNGEMASLGDVEAVGKTINLLGDNISQVIPLDASSTNKLVTMNDIVPKCVRFMSLHINESPKNTYISCNAGDLGRTIIVIGSGNSSAGDNTHSEIGMIRCGYDSNNVEYTRISVSGPHSAPVINSVTSDSDGNIIIAGNGFNSTLVLISNKEF